MPATLITGEVWRQAYRGALCNKGGKEGVAGVEWCLVAGTMDYEADIKRNGTLWRERGPGFFYCVNRLLTTSLVYPNS